MRVQQGSSEDNFANSNEGNNFRKPDLEFKLDED